MGYSNGKCEGIEEILWGRIVLGKVRGERL